jgi:hypothetical protein
MTECGNTIVNPFCLVLEPTDPYSWYYLNNTWSFADPYSALVSYVEDDVTMYNGRIYVCSGAGSPSVCTGAPTAGVNGWVTLTSLQPAGFKQIECTATGPPMPDQQSGKCELSALNGTAAACVNPCIRLSNSSLAVNKNTSQCRVFPNATSAGNNLSAPAACPTVCPQACVELWQECPPGTAPLTTLVQTKGIDDLMSLTSPLKLDGSPNPLWPTNYAMAQGATAPAIGGKPYIECYPYNTDFCELPMAWQETTTGVLPTGPLGTSGPITVCYSNCPQGTVQDPTDPYTCLFVPLSGTFDPSTYGPTTPVQKVFCNPQYFNPAYWTTANYGGTQKGCTAKALPSKQGSSCPAGTAPYINSNFNIEWCMPTCPAGYFNDLTNSSCLATCEGSVANALGAPDTRSTVPEYNQYLDYVDFYATTNRCLPYGSSTTKEVDCIQNGTEGRCPAISREQPNSQKYTFSTTASPENVIAKSGSINRQCNEKRYRQWQQTGGQSGMSRTQYMQWKNSLALVDAYQASYPVGPSKGSDYYGETYGQCPDGMVFGAAECQEATGQCYDVCMEGYEPVAFCSNGASACAQSLLVYACRALCPGPDEGLGPWVQVDLDGGVFTCAYQYPQGIVPKDPNLWVQCPEDGRYFVLNNTSTGAPTSTLNRKEPLCIRTQYLRQVTCPIGFNEAAETPGEAPQCLQACDSSEMIVTTSDGTVLCQAPPQSTNRHEVDFAAAVDSSNSKAPFRNRILRRKNFLRGQGIDPNVGLTDPNIVPNRTPTYVGFAAAGVAVVVLFLFLKR